MPLFLEKGTKVKVDTRDGRLPRPRHRLSRASVSARTKARKRALDILFGADVRGDDLAAMLAEEAGARGQRARSASRRGCTPARSSTASIDNLDEIDARDRRRTRKGWSLAAHARRRPRDRPHRRRGRSCTTTRSRTRVAIAEAVERATVLSTDDSAGFLNGLLGGIARGKDLDAS